MDTLTRRTIHVLIQIPDGTLLKGMLLIERNTRLSDVLNNAKDFIVLTDYDEKAHIINKRHIIQAIELDELKVD
ncbi:hypothetical protein [Beggiatoa leptomitoformis]|uniref:Uncharacterized protein n=1 Tax=Beggiatoa leptomitoformis TaxID=288004 RepID=A0A2N9YAX3_9GAMM|nr:hypothetical protein [Beggiatoa leptomitoformis]ALG67006.1 hypothetical protein AL038_03840 [Beggiatoa leptomitoformis]AUI67618.1 hypothetical protein BLE401_02170 [Beggiatoa leptomitoformis]